MQSDNEQLHVEFHNRANAIFFRLLNSFEAAVKDINRKKEERKFMQQKETHINALKQQLESCAGELIIEHPQNRSQRELNQNLQHFITQYLHQFVQKIRTF
jgi:ABC-type Fe3+-citrate transport system substrate-binding protein